MKLKQTDPNLKTSPRKKPSGFKIVEAYCRIKKKSPKEKALENHKEYLERKSNPQRRGPGFKESSLVW